MESALVGTCERMCPLAELYEHEHGAISEFEMNPKTRRFDRELAIKMFHRSAAGNVTDPMNIRPLPVLVKTMNHITTFIIGQRMNSSRNTSEIHTLNYVCNRLRAIRMDITQQKLVSRDVLEIFGKSLLFLIWADQRFRSSEWHSSFDRIQNLEQIIQNLMMIQEQLCCLDEKDRIYECEFHALHLLVYINHPDFVAQLKSLPDYVLKSKPVKWVLRLRMYVVQNNTPGYIETAKTMPVQYEVFALRTMRILVEKTLGSLRYMGKHSFSRTLIDPLEIPTDNLSEYQSAFGIVEEKGGLAFKTQPMDTRKLQDVVPDDTLTRFNQISLVDFMKLETLRV